MKHWPPRIAEAAEPRGRGRRAHRRRARARAALLAPLDRRLPEAARGRPRRPRRARASSRAGTTSRASSRVLADRVRGTAPTSSSPPTACPQRILAEGDPYQAQLLETARLVAERGRRRALVVLATRASRRRASRGSGRTSSTTSPSCTTDGVDDVLVCPVGFVSDHLEIRWDIDTEAVEKARELGMRLRADRDAERRPAPSCGVLAGLVRAGARATLDCMRNGEIAVEGVVAALRRPRAGQRARSRTSSSRAAARRAPRSGRCATSRSRVEPGEAVGLVGRNGSGKTTLLRLVSRDHQADRGPRRGRRADRLAARARRRLPPRVHRPRERLPERLDPRAQARARSTSCMDEIVAFAELERFIDLPVRTYSSGMYMRLGFAVAAHIQADVLLLDEVFAVGDEAFQRKCFGKIFEFKQRGGTIVFVSHDATAVERLCDRAVLLRGGELVFDGSTHEAILRYHRLLAAEREPGRAARRAALSGAAAEARIEDVALLDADGERAAPVRGRRAADACACASSPTSRCRRRGSRSSCSTSTGSCSPSTRRRPPSSAGSSAPGERSLRFERRPAPARRRPLPPPLRARRRRRRPLPPARRRGRVPRRPGGRRGGRAAARGPLVVAGDRRRPPN